MGLDTSKQLKPVSQVNVGDTIVRPTWGGLSHEERKVVHVDDERRYALACNESTDALYIVNLEHHGGNFPPGQSVEARCSCSRFLAAPVEERHALVWGF